MLACTLDDDAHYHDEGQTEAFELMEQERQPEALPPDDKAGVEVRQQKVDLDPQTESGERDVG